MNLINSSASLGGEIIGIKIDEKLTKDHIDFINTSWDERLVLVFKNQNIDDKTLINFSKNFGELLFTILFNNINRAALNSL